MSMKPETKYQGAKTHEQWKVFPYASQSFPITSRNSQFEGAPSPFLLPIIALNSQFLLLIDSTRHVKALREEICRVTPLLFSPMQESSEPLTTDTYFFFLKFWKEKLRRRASGHLHIYICSFMHNKQMKAQVQYNFTCKLFVCGKL